MILKQQAIPQTISDEPSIPLSILTVIPILPYTEYVTDDNDYDYTGQLSRIRPYFARCYQLMGEYLNRSITREECELFNREWQSAVNQCQDKHLFSDSSQSEKHLLNMWLYVLGCPRHIRSEIGLLSTIAQNLTQTNWSYGANYVPKFYAVRSLVWSSFRPILAKLIVDRLLDCQTTDTVIQLIHDICQPMNLEVITSSSQKNC